MKVFDFSCWQGYGATSSRTRNRMVDELVDEGISHEKVLDIMRVTPRHCFIDSALAHQAYKQVSLPIVGGQTISQPFIVAYMSEYLLNHACGFEHVLEIGTGCGYQSVVLAQCFEKVCSIERVKVLHEFATERFVEFGIDNIHPIYGDGYSGWPDQCLFDAVILTAASQAVPEAVLKQMKVGGVLIAPLESIEGSQYLVGIHREQKGFIKQVLMPVNFVAMLSGVKST